MTVWGVVFLGIIAVSSIVQAAFLIGLTLSGRRLAARLDLMQDRLDRDVRPALESLTRVSRNVAEISDTAVLQARRIDDLLADTLAKVEDTTEQVRKIILRPLGPMVDIAAFLKGVRRGLEVYQQLRGFEGRKDAYRGRRTEEDEHLFI